MIKRIRVTLLLSFILTFCGGTVWAFQMPVNKVDIIDDGEKTSLNTTCETVGELLLNRGIELDSDTKMNVQINDAIEDNMQIEIERAFIVIVLVDGTPKLIRTNVGTVGGLLDKEVKQVANGFELVSHNRDDKLEKGMTIEVLTNYENIIIVDEIIPFEIEEVETDALPLGETAIKQKGRDGEKEIEIVQMFLGGELVNEVPGNETVVKQPVNEIIEVGTFQENVVPESSYTVSTMALEKPLVYAALYQMEATAYTTDRGDSGPRTATGESAQVGLVAVDPRVIPLGTMLYIENYGVARAADTGGAIKGKKIDLFFDTYRECVNFGRRNVTVYVLADE